MDSPLERHLSALRNDPNLRPFIIKDAKPTGRTLGSGSYGSVEEIKVDELVCAGKVIHEILLTGEASIIAEKYVQECHLMASLRHPNVTLFLGVCLLPSATLPVLVMEKLEGSLDDLLETAPNIPLALKRSILEDVARGLLYLHRRDPPIIHRDLSANNVLLTSSFTAKISDLGNSRIVSLQLEKLKLTQVPGATTYMPPEALNMDPHYGPSLDIFSFGHLGLYTGLQIFPCKLLPHTYTDPDLDRLVGRTELERRQPYFDQLENSFPGQDQHPFVQLMKKCLHDTPSERPTTAVLLKTLQEMRPAIEGPYGSYSIVKQDLMRQVTVARTLKQSENEVKEKDKEIKRLQQELKQSRENAQELSVKLAKAEESPKAVAEAKRPKAFEGNPAQQDSCVLEIGPEYKLGEHWTKVKLLDEGRWHELHLCHDLANGTFFAVKEICYRRNSSANRKRAFEGIMDEISILSKLHHPNVVRFFGYSQDEEENTMYLFMEYKWMMGENLEQVVDFLGHPFSESVVANYTRQLTSGIAYLHDNEIVHTNLNGYNVLCEYTGHRICISGIGESPKLEPLISKFFRRGSFSRPDGDEKSIKDSMAYSAPEVLWLGADKGKSVEGGIKCDVWSIGCVIILMATGKPPWLVTLEDGGHASKFELLLTIGNATEPPPSPDFSNSSLKDFTSRCLKLDPTERPTSAELLKHRLITGDSLPSTSKQ